MPSSGGSGQDVGGSVGESWTTMSIHGSSRLAMPLLFDGMSYTHLSETGGGYRTEFVINSGAVQEMSVTVGGKSAESDVSGVTVNSIPKSGSNIFSGSLFGNYTNNDLQTDNLTAALRARGLTNVNKQLKVWDFNPTFGGPIAKDRLWFFSAYRHWGEKNTIAGMYYNLNPTGFSYVPDLTPSGRLRSMELERHRPADVAGDIAQQVQHPPRPPAARVEPGRQRDRVAGSGHQPHQRSAVPDAGHLELTGFEPFSS